MVRDGAARATDATTHRVTMTPARAGRGIGRPSVDMTEHEPLPSLLREAQRTGKRLVVDGEPWLVYELPASTFDRRSSPSLIFESESTVRRVRAYPADWRSLSDEDLFALSWTT